MQKLHFLFSAFLLFSVAAGAQHFDENKESAVRFGAKAGVNINKIAGEAFRDKYSYNYTLGGFAQINFSRKIGIQPEINFTQSSAEVSDDASTVYDDLFLDGNQKKAKLNYLKVPVLLNVDLGTSNRFKLQVGPQWGKLLHTNTDDKSFFKGSDISALGGLWLQLPVINLGARYEVGLSNINDAVHQDKWKSQAFQFFAGITF